MPQKLNLRARQFFILVTLYMLGSAILIMPGNLAIVSKQDAWIAAVMVILIGLGTMWLVFGVYKRFPEKNLVEINAEVFGRRLGFLASLLFFILFTFTITALTIRNLGDFVVTTMIPDTPLGLITIMFILVIIYSAKVGFTAATYASEIFFPWVVIIFIVLCLALLTEMKLDNIKPLFDNGVKPIIGAALHHSGFPFMESVIFLMLACETKQGEKIGKAWFFGILTSGVMLTILTFMAISVLGPIQTNLAIYPTLELAKHIQIGRIEIIISILWFITILIRLIVIFYVTLIGLAQTFRWQGYKFFSFPLGLLVMEAMILYVPNSGYLFELYKVWGNYAFVWGVVYPVLLLVLPKRKNDNSPAA